LPITLPRFTVPAEMAQRRESVLKAGLPYFVAEFDEALAGYGYAYRYKSRPGYANTVEDTVYVADWAQRRGVGRTLLDALIVACEAAGKRQMIAIIGDSANAPSIRLHEACGFHRMGTLKNVGFKHGRWLDTVLMQRALGRGAQTSPGVPDAPIV